jgi:hypothetical protein
VKVVVDEFETQMSNNNEKVGICKCMIHNKLDPTHTGPSNSPFPTSRINDTDYHIAYSQMTITCC